MVDDGPSLLLCSQLSRILLAVAQCRAEHACCWLWRDTFQEEENVMFWLPEIDVPGPYSEVPLDADAEKPWPAIED